MFYEALLFERQINIRDVIPDANKVVRTLGNFLLRNAFKALIICFFCSQSISNIIMVASGALDIVGIMSQNRFLSYIDL